MEDSGIQIIGILLLLLSSLANAFSQVLVKRYPTDPLLLTSTQMFFGGAMLLITSLFTEEVSLEAIPLEFYGALLWLSFVSAAAFSIWYSLLQKQEMKITEINIVKFLIPISGAVLSWIVFAEEHPDILSIIGMSIISISVILFYSQRQTAEQQEVKP